MLQAADIGNLDWIEDFDEVKRTARAVIDEHLDHAFILDSRDEALIAALRKVEPCRLYLLDSAAPTAERIAQELYRLIRPQVDTLAGVRVWETEIQSGEYRALYE